MKNKVELENAKIKRKNITKLRKEKEKKISLRSIPYSFLPKHNHARNNEKSFYSLSVSPPHRFSSPPSLSLSLSLRHCQCRRLLIALLNRRNIRYFSNRFRRTFLTGDPRGGSLIISRVFYSFSALSFDSCLIALASPPPSCLRHADVERTKPRPMRT